MNDKKFSFKSQFPSLFSINPPFGGWGGFLLFISFSSFAQTPVTDKANNAQLQKMVDIRWNNWQPDPGTHNVLFVPVPNSVEGYVYWRVLHSDYYYGEDQRPYRAGGPFTQNYASLLLQAQNDKAIADTSNAVMQTNLATYINMSGGDLDVSYSLYFQNKFDELNNDLNRFLSSIEATDPGAYNYIIASQVFQDYVEYTNQINDRINALHNAFADKGERMNAYLEIIKERTKKNIFFKKSFALLKGQYDEKQAAQAIQPAVKNFKTTNEKIIPNNDKQHVQTILKKFKF